MRLNGQLTECGQSTEWKDESGQQKFVIFLQLAPKDQTFMVLMIASDGLHALNENGVSLCWASAGATSTAPNVGLQRWR